MCDSMILLLVQKLYIGKVIPYLDISIYGYKERLPDSFLLCIDIIQNTTEYILVKRALVKSRSAIRFQYNSI